MSYFFLISCSLNLRAPVYSEKSESFSTLFLYCVNYLFIPLGNGVKEFRWDL